jgi:hypothetical protein
LRGSEVRGFYVASGRLGGHFSGTSFVILPYIPENLKENRNSAGESWQTVARFDGRFDNMALVSRITNDRFHGARQ